MSSPTELFKVAEIQVKYERFYQLDRMQIRTSKHTYDILKKVWDIDTLDYIENFYILLLDKSNSVLGVSHISKGGTAGTIVDAKVIFGKAILTNASSIVLAHNHPSGNLRPSNKDKEVTRKLKEGGLLLDIHVLDHVIISSNGYYSFADDGMI